MKRERKRGKVLGGNINAKYLDAGTRRGRKVTYPHIYSRNILLQGFGGYVDIAVI